jgi:hypothetical protein
MSDANQPPSSSSSAQTLTPEQRSYQQYRNVTYGLSWALIFLCPAIIVAPPRKLDFYTVSLGGAWLLSANNISRERTGRSLPAYLLTPSWAISGSDGGKFPSERARLVHEQLRKERERREQAQGVQDKKDIRVQEKKGIEAQEKKDAGVLGKLWMGSEKEGWKERRLQEEQEALEQGKGYGSLIMDHVRDAWKPGSNEKSDK